MTTVSEVAADPSRYAARPDRVTVFDSNGIPMEDVVAAGLAYQRAKQSNIGSSITLAGAT